jgi:hypothetical protein
LLTGEKTWFRSARAFLSAFFFPTKEITCAESKTACASLDSSLARRTPKEGGEKMRKCTHHHYGCGCRDGSASEKMPSFTHHGNEYIEAKFKKMERALRIIQVWAVARDDLNTLKDIERKAAEALKED